VSAGGAGACGGFPALLPFVSFREPFVMTESNPIRAHIEDLRERVESLRGYL
jgi:hypothetical protein